MNSLYPLETAESFKLSLAEPKCQIDKLLRNQVIYFRRELKYRYVSHIFLVILKWHSWNDTSKMPFLEVDFFFMVIDSLKDTNDFV